MVDKKTFYETSAANILKILLNGQKKVWLNNEDEWQLRNQLYIILKKTKSWISVFLRATVLGFKVIYYFRR